MNKKYCLSYKNSELKNLQEIECEILLVFSKLCDKHNLEWVAIGGTILGAVRHSGFIPWDDDIDVAMRRSDYERFILIAQNELPDEYFLQNFCTEHNYNGYFTKIRKNNTLFVENCVKNIKMHQGVFIDIFPLDNIPDDIKELAKFNRKLFFWYQLYMSKSTIMPASNVIGRKKIIVTIIRSVLHLILLPVPKKNLFCKIDKLFQKYNDKKTEMIGFVYLSNMSFKISEIYPIKEIKFEAIRINAPADCESYLKRQYGNYLQLPEEQYRINHRPILLKI